LGLILWQWLSFGVLVPAVGAAPLVVGIAVKGADAGELPTVYATGKTDFSLVVTAADSLEPQVRADLFATTESLAAPVFKDFPIVLRREGPARGGIQRFDFTLAFPIAKARQKYLLQMRVRPSASADPWLPLPPFRFTSVPEIWRDDLKDFTSRVTSGRSPAQTNIADFFSQAGVVVEAAEPWVQDSHVQAWFYESTAENMPEVGARSVVFVFKPAISGGVMLRRAASGRSFLIQVDDSVLTSLPSSPAAQEILHRALAMADVLISPSSVPTDNP
jgi:hypothetical protein